MDTHQNANVYAAAHSPELGEALVSHTFLNFINSILMDDCYDHHCASASSQDLSHSYQHIFDGFHDILCQTAPFSSSLQLSSTSVGSGYGSFGDLHMSDFKCGTHEEDTLHASCGTHEDTLHASDLLVYNGADIEMRDSIKYMSFGMVQDRAMPFQPNILLDQQAASKEQYDHELQISNSSFLPTATTSKTHASHVATNCSGYGALGHLPIHKDPIGLRTSLTARKGDVSFVRNADLAAEVHAQLFDEWPGRDKKELVAFTALGVAPAHQKDKGREDAALTSPVDIKALLLSSAKALGEGGNMKMVMQLLEKVKQQGASPCGSGLQRVAHYFSEALIARMSGMGRTLYAAILNTSPLPTAMMMLKAYKLLFEVCPYLKIAHYFANQYILKAVSGASSLHIVDYGILYGFQWPCLIYALAHRRGGPPFIRITGIELPAKLSDINSAATTEGTGRRLMEYAKTYHVPFEYHAISASNWEDIEPSSLHILADEVLVVNSFNRLRHLHDESAISSSPRDQLLRKIRSLNPQLLVTGFMNASHSSPFFAPRFREALHYYSNMFDTIHTTVFGDSPERAMFEREIMGPAILNVVACEGVERVERPETYKQWQARLERAGFRQRPIIPSVLSTAQAVLKSYHKDFGLLHPSNMWILLGWRGRTMQALSAWEPAASPIQQDR